VITVDEEFNCGFLKAVLKFKKQAPISLLTYGGLKLVLNIYSAKA
jgi:hypothetical protein